MKLVILMGLVYAVRSIEHHEKATSYQKIHMEHFHAVPTYVKKEDRHFLEHPISLGTSSSKVEIHHGDKHDHGYALASAENNVFGHHGFEDFNEGLGGHDQGENYYQGQLGQAALGHDGANLHYQLPQSSDEGYAGFGQVHGYDAHES